MNNQKGFTLIEMLVVISIIGILTTVVVIAINPVHQIAKAHDTQRKTDIYSILSAVYQYTAEHNGALPDTDGNPLTSNFPTTSTCIGTQSPCFNLGNAGGSSSERIVPVYLPTMVKDPKTGTDANTGYYIYVDAYSHLHASAVGEVENPITVVR